MSRATPGPCPRAQTGGVAARGPAVQPPSRAQRRGLSEPGAGLGGRVIFAPRARFNACGPSARAALDVASSGAGPGGGRGGLRWCRGGPGPAGRSAHRSVSVAVNGSSATITIETCEDPSDWTTTVGGAAFPVDCVWVGAWPGPHGRRGSAGAVSPGAQSLRPLAWPTAGRLGLSSVEALPAPELWPPAVLCSIVVRSPWRAGSTSCPLSRSLFPQMTPLPSGEGSRTLACWTRSSRNSTRSWWRP